MTSPDDWIERWNEGRIGWHQPDGHPALAKHWRPRDRRVLVPLCGKSPDLVRLARLGNEVVGVELSERAVRDFFAEHELGFTVHDGALAIYRAVELPITIHCGDYFEVERLECDAHYDRAALVALPASRRPAYAAHTDRSLSADADRLVITLAYDQSAVDGPPYSVDAAEVLAYWPRLEPVASCNAIAEVPEKFRDAGLTEVRETVWRFSRVPIGCRP